MSDERGDGFVVVGPHDRTLLEHVRPPDWTNPEPADRYHLVVVGGGTAGLVSAAGAAGLGARVALVERGMLGGDCLNVGCVPSKGLIRAARSWHAARESRSRFGGPAADGPGDFAAAMDRMRRLRARIAPHDSAARFAALGVDVFLGQGRFVGADALEVEGATLRFRRAVIATGGRGAAPPVPGLDEVGYLTNETVFSLTELPARLGVIGAGPIGCELAQTFARLGSRVSVFEMGDRILAHDDPDAAAIVARALTADGVELTLGAGVERVEVRDGGIVVAVSGGDRPGTTTVDALLVAAGRRPNVEGLGLESAGVAHGRAGVTVDDRLRTSNPRIYACGDVASERRFTHLADAQARIVIQNALFFGRRKASDVVVPWCTYTSPEVAHVGLTAEQASAAGHRVATLRVDLAEVDRAVLDGEAEGFLKVHHEKGTILGATVVAANAGDLAGELALAITNRVGLGAISATVHAYPTQAEVIKKAGDAYRRGALTPTVRRLFGLWFRLFR